MTGSSVFNVEEEPAYPSAGQRQPTFPSPSQTSDFTPSLLRNRQRLEGKLTARRLLPAQLLRGLEDKRVLALLCVFCPPAAVFIVSGINRKFALCFLLWCCIMVPGVLFALYVVFLEKVVNPSDSPTFDV